MWVSFSLQNFGSFAEKQTFSMVAGTRSGRIGQFSFPTGHAMAPHLLRSACIFGPNGAGKTTLGWAIGFFLDFINTSAKESQVGEPIPVVPFRLDEQWTDKPTEMEIIFILDGILYQYGFAVDGERVWSEWLFTRSNQERRTRKVFQREYDEENDTYQWYINKSQLKGPTDLWQQATRESALFFSTATQLNAVGFTAPFLWLQQQFHAMPSPDRLSPRFTAKRCQEGGEWNKKVLDFLQSTGLPIVDLEIQTEEKEVVDSEQSKRNQRKRVTYQVIFYHRGKSGERVPILFSEESDGSQVLFSLAGPWIDVLEHGRTLFVDELHNSLHPHILRVLVGLFHNPEINIHHAQLVFTSHETSILAEGLMHQDQIWVVEKGEEGASLLCPLSAFKVPNMVDFQKSYLDGRFGGVPVTRMIGVDGEEGDHGQE